MKKLELFTNNYESNTNEELMEMFGSQYIQSKLEEPDIYFNNEETESEMQTFNTNPLQIYNQIPNNSQNLPHHQNKQNPLPTKKSQKPPHNRESPDNIRRNLKVKINDLLTNFLNSLIKKRGYKVDKIGKLNSKHTKNVTIKFNKIFFEQTILDILNTYEVTGDKRSADKINFNKNIIDQIKDDEKIQYILSMKYGEFFERFFMYKDEEGLEEDELYKNIIKEDECKKHTLKNWNSKLNSEKDCNYKAKINEVVKNLINFYK